MNVLAASPGGGASGGGSGVDIMSVPARAETFCTYCFVRVDGSCGVSCGVEGSQLSPGGAVDSSCGAICGVEMQTALEVVLPEDDEVSDAVH